jgi:hypothetical protein
MSRETKGQLWSGGKGTKATSGVALLCPGRGAFDEIGGSNHLRVDVPVSGLEGSLDSGPDLVGLSNGV